jgi:hypothetical protein
MLITIIAAALLLWLVLGGIVAIIVCPLLKAKHADAHPTPSLEHSGDVIVPHARSQSVR